ncbi:MAG: hypothetical protein H6719_26735 [Sandaracinaceae bacterium]|nr:hypothetical protein [Sandaracinaceae bacterium]
MSTNAIGVLKIDPALVREALPAVGGDDVRRGANGEPVRIRALDNATLVHLEASVTEDPEVLGFGLAAQLGELLAAHSDPRGVPVYPESYALTAKTWDAAIEELGDGAEWIALPSAGPAGFADLGAMLGGGAPDLAAMFGGGGAPDLAAMLGGGGGQLGALAQQLQGPEGAAMLQQAMQMAQQMAQNGSLNELARKMAGATTPEEALAQAGASPAALGGLDLGAMMQQAQSMLSANPDLERQLREQLGGLAEDEPEEDE